MRLVDARAQAIRERRGALIEVPIVYVEALDGATVVGVGFWGGDEDAVIRVTSLWTGVRQALPFYGAGAFLDISPIRHEAGLSIRPVTLTLSSLAPAVQEAFRVYDARGARVSIWRRSYDPTNRKPIAVEPWFRGYVDGADFERPAVGGEAQVSVDVVSTARMLTISSALRKSDEAQQARAPGDRFRRHKSTIASAEVPWGQKSERIG